MTRFSLLTFGIALTTLGVCCLRCCVHKLETGKLPNVRQMRNAYPYLSDRYVRVIAYMELGSNLFLASFSICAGLVLFIAMILKCGV